MQHLTPDKAVDDMLRDFFGGRLPPFEKGVKKGEFTINILDYDRVVPDFRLVRQARRERNPPKEKGLLVV